jgi:hypothetical protein
MTNWSRVEELLPGPFNRTTFLSLDTQTKFMTLMTRFLLFFICALPLMLKGQPAPETNPPIRYTLEYQDQERESFVPLGGGLLQGLPPYLVGATGFSLLHS